MQIFLAKIVIFVSGGVGSQFAFGFTCCFHL